MGGRCKKEYSVMPVLKSKCVFIALCFVLQLNVSCDSKLTTASSEETAGVIIDEKVNDSLFGLSLKEFDVVFDTIQSGWTLSHMLLPHQVSQYQVNLSDVLMRDSTIGLNYVNVGRPYAVFYANQDTSRFAKYVVYEPDVYSYVMFDYTSDSVVVTKTMKDVRIKERLISGEIHKNSNLSIEINKHVY